ncbi:hypothetical protein G7Y89_g2159 [Cudoniella acicularis]|uniref:Uncharacterized protein n=1 Tax=Cudoniella acicularis TaxID=354080 RepID=A0A8H4W6R4_9HELO|nr:hypothetical protein G7Y89_g2159 [Cudoniella acicularis]
MISETSLALAITLPLLLCVCILLSIFAFLFLRFRRHRTQQQQAFEQELNQANDKIATVERQLAKYPKVWGGPGVHNTDLADSDSNLLSSYCDLASSINIYLGKWIVYGSSSPTIKDSVARIEALLFPEPPPIEFITQGKDTSLFPNPHNYTPEEICTLLENSRTRKPMFHYILFSILLKSISVEGNPRQSLLPLQPVDIYALDKLRDLIRGVECMFLSLLPYTLLSFEMWANKFLGSVFSKVPVYISRFAIRNAERPSPDYYKKTPYLELFNSLFEPYFRTQSAPDKLQRAADMDGFLDAAIQHGLRALGVGFDKIEYRWGARRDGFMAEIPQLHGLYHSPTEPVQAIQVCDGQSSNLVGLDTGHHLATLRA